MPSSPREERTSSSNTPSTTSMTQIYTRAGITPIHELQFSYEQRHPDAHSLRELNRLPASFPIDRRYESNTWKQVPSEVPVADLKREPFDTPSMRMGDDYRTRPDLSQRPPRDQLPPLSSLLAGARPDYPSRSSYSDRSPIFSSSSPQDSRRIPPPTAEKRSWDQTFPPQTHSQSTSSQRPYGSGPAQPHATELPALAPPPHRHDSGKPSSPHYYDSGLGSDASRGSVSTRGSLPSNLLSSYSETAQREHVVPTDRDGSMLYQARDHHPHQPYQRHEPENRGPHREPPLTTPSTTQYPATPLSTVVADPSTPKDGLGPKIWTGTQFLPRFLRQAEVPGEGLCYFYDDGTHCKTHIDGEAVNAHWGVTKAGKPRKRLAIACITCREKKIKCDPDYPRCIQCEKFGRVCKFKNAPRGGQATPETASADGEELTRPVSQRSDLESYNSGMHNRQNSSPVHGHPSPDESGRAAKRIKREFDGFASTKYEQGPGYFSSGVVGSHDGQSEGRWSPLDHRRSIDSTIQQLMTNPYDSEEGLVRELMSCYFFNINLTTFCMFPQQPFMHWLQDRSIRKSPDDLMLIYSILAVGTVFCSRQDVKERGRAFAAVSRYASDQRHFSLQLVQSRLLLGLYYYANDNPNDSWDFCGAGLRAAAGMRLNVELDLTNGIETQSLPFNLTIHGYAECRRRTFWAGYIMDRFKGFCNGRLSTLNEADIFLRLPCDVKSFEDQVEVVNPFFDPSNLSVQDTRGTVGSMAYLVNICSIWGDVMSNIYRSSQKPINSATSATFIDFYNNTCKRLEDWSKALPECFTFSEQNLDKTTEYGICGTFVTMHSVYHATVMKLNRLVLPDTLSNAQRQNQMQIAHTHAAAVLKMSDSIMTRRIRMPTNEDAMKCCGSTFVGYAITAAVDILSAKGRLADAAGLGCRIHSSIDVLEDLGEFWQSARVQRPLIRRRAALVSSLAMADETKKGVTGVKIIAGLWEIERPIEKTFARGYDLFYAAGANVEKGSSGFEY